MSVVMIPISGKDQPTMVEDMTCCTSHRDDGDVFFFHVMPTDQADNPLGVLEWMDADPVAFWQYVKQKQPLLNVPDQLLKDGTWVTPYQYAANLDRQGLSATCPVCRCVVVSLSAPNVMVRSATANHTCP